MSSGQKAWADECDDKAMEAHHTRLETFGISAVANTVDKITEHFKYLEQSIPSLPRSGWYRIDEIKKELRKLA